VVNTSGRRFRADAGAGHNGAMARRSGGSAGGTRPQVCVNRRARHDFDLLETVEAGLVLTGSEVKALREGKGNLVDAYVRIRDGRATLVNLEISPYSHDPQQRHEPRRPRGLLLHRGEIAKLDARVREKGLVLVPLAIYFKGPWAKVEVALARPRRKYDKREALKRREAQREMDRALRGR